jgi:2-methylcitrate dehydratase PrpD
MGIKQELAQVECVVDPDLDRTFPKQWCATTEILTNDGKRYFTKVEYPKGDPENPLTWEEVIGKFNDLSGCFITKERRSKIVNQVKKLEEIRDFRKWSPILLRN